MEACQQMVCEHFSSILNSREGGKFLNELHYKYFLQLVSGDKLGVREDKDVVKAINEYIEARQGLPLLPEENPANEITHLTVEEKKARDDKKEAADGEE
jgi:hypothetical protein